MFTLSIPDSPSSFSLVILLQHLDTSKSLYQEVIVLLRRRSYSLLNDAFGRYLVSFPFAELGIVLQQYQGLCIFLRKGENDTSD